MFSRRQRVAFALLASAVLTLLASSSAPTPLYAIYQSRWDFSDVTITVIFGVYAVAVLVSLLVFGSLSDHIGRRPVLAAALLAQVLVMLVFATASGLDVLLLARVLQGLATGAALGAIGAGLVDLHPTHGPVANSAAAMAGTASGALGSALLVQLLPAPTQLVYLLMAALFLTQAAGIAGIRETSPRAPGARASLRPTLALPGPVRSALLVAAPSLVAVWALAGFYGSLGPSLTGLVSGSHSTILGGASLFVLAMSGPLTIVAFHNTDARRFALVGSGAGHRRSQRGVVVDHGPVRRRVLPRHGDRRRRLWSRLSGRGCGRSCRWLSPISARVSSPSPTSSPTWRWGYRRCSLVSSWFTAR